MLRQSIHAHTGQQLPLVQRFPLFADAGRHAAELWLQCAPLSMAEFRDLRYRNLIAGLGYLDEAHARREAFNGGFATQIARAIVEQSRVEVRHG